MIATASQIVNPLRHGNPLRFMHFIHTNYMDDKTNMNVISINLHRLILSYIAVNVLNREINNLLVTTFSKIKVDNVLVSMFSLTKA